MSTNTTTHALIEARSVVPAGESLAISISLHRHDALYLIGPDSARLCRYLRTLAGVEPPQHGDLLLLGKTLKNMDKKDWREQRQHIGFVARNAPLLSVLPAIDNVMLPALYHKRMTRAVAREKTIELLVEIDCNGDFHKLPAYLTQQQRLQFAIARATILDPAILFAEEPFFGMSLAEQQPIYQYLVNSISKRALVAATHNLRLVRESATQIIFLGKKQVQHFSSWNQLANSGLNEIENYLLHYQHQYQTVSTHG
jgi:putative ABC transport system ATP-binding protein